MKEHPWSDGACPLEEARRSAEMIHLLTCSTCRSWFVGRLLEEESGVPAAGTEEESLYAAVWSRLEAHGPELIEQSRRRREEADRLLFELMGTARKKRGDLLGTERFRSLDLLELLLEASHASQIGDPRRSEELAGLAARLAATFGDSEEEAAAAVTRAFCLAANARRLRGLKGAEAHLAKAAPFLSFRSERAFYCRTAALLRWEEGRRDEAAALLQHAVLLYSQEGTAGEEGTCLALLGLLHHEEGIAATALPLLLRGWSAMDRALRPSLAVRAGLALASSLAMAEQPEKARAVLKTVWQFLPEIEDPMEMLRAQWLEGRALALLGEVDEGRQMLESVRAELIAERSPAEAALVALDLALILAESGRWAEIGPLASGLEAAFPLRPLLSLATAGMLKLSARAQRGEPHLREAAFAEAAALRQTFRSFGLRLRPLPFS